MCSITKIILKTYSIHLNMFNSHSMLLPKNKSIIEKYKNPRAEWTRYNNAIPGENDEHSCRQL